MDTRDKVAWWIAEYDRIAKVLIEEGRFRESEQRIVLDLKIYAQCIYCTEINNEKSGLRDLDRILDYVKRYTTKIKHGDGYVLNTVKESKENNKFVPSFFFRLAFYASHGNVDDMAFLRKFILLQYYMKLEEYSYLSGDAGREQKDEDIQELEEVRSLIEVNLKDELKDVYREDSRLAESHQLLDYCRKSQAWLQNTRNISEKLVNTD